ncbi:MAG: hydroxyacid dehydrogenase, partial [Chloroflexi bacterium]|nr:hydroxyacid dehydrogenase [Chloroflexota bacterium]
MDSWEQERVRQRLSAAPSPLAVECLSERLSLTNAERFADAEGIGIFVYTTVDQALLARLPQLRLVLTMSTGYDHIDRAACAARGITVCSVPHYGENTVAEHTFALILALSRKVHHAYRRVQQGDFTLDGLRGFDLAGKTLGVIGAGNIGLHVIRIARGFGMQVLAYD